MMSCEKSYLNRIHRTAFLLDTEYIDIIRGNNQNAYTRKRKILLPHIFMQMLATTGKSQKNEISDFIEQVDENIEISQTGYFNARMKFNPDALRTILHDINRDVYAEKKLLKLNDYYIMAIDGSDFLIPKWRDNKEVWKTKLHDGDNDPVMGSASSIFDVINKCIIDISINSYKYSEKSSAEDHLGYARDILPQGSKMDMLNIKELEEMGKKAGFSYVALLKSDSIQLMPEVREMCKNNTCHMYAKRWSCPPGCGDLEVCRKKIEKYREGIIVQTVGKLEDPLDGETMMETEAVHKQNFYEFEKMLRERWPGMLPIGAGCCTKCKTCTYPDAPCRFPEQAFSSMEAYGMLVTQVCQANGLEYYYGPCTIAYTSCYLLE